MTMTFSPMTSSLSLSSQCREQSQSIDSFTSSSSSVRERRIMSILRKKEVAAEEQEDHKSSDHILSALSLSQWIRKYGKRSDINTEDDEKSLKRLIINDLPEETPTDNNESSGGGPTLQATRRQHFNLTGCLQQDIYCSTHSKLGDKTLHGVVTEASFFNDWQRLWEHLEDDPEDALRQHTPLFCLAVDFFFHQRTFQIYAFLILYNIVSGLIVAKAVSSPVGAYWSLALSTLTVLARAAAYCVVFALFNGHYPSLIAQPTETTQRGAASSSTSISHSCSSPENNIEQMPGKTNYYTLHWSTTLRQLFVKSFREIPILCKEYFLGENDARAPKKKLCFRDLLNLSIKFLVRHNGVSAQKMHWNRTLFRVLCIAIVLAVPLYCAVYIAGFQAFYTSGSCARHDSYCAFDILYIVTSFGMLTTITVQSIFMSGILTGLVGLAYAGELAFRLSESWIEKFACLRRLKLTTPRDVCFAFRPGTTPKNCAALHAELLAHPEDAVSAKERLVALITRDATEHYLFLREVMLCADRTWGMVLVGWFFLAAYLVIVYTVYVLTVLTTSRETIVIEIGVIAGSRVFILVVYPVICICHANACVYKLRNCFQVASNEDYDYIKGKERWIKLFETNPAVWTFFGLWLTFDKLSGLLWTAIMALGAYVFTTMF